MMNTENTRKIIKVLQGTQNYSIRWNDGTEIGIIPRARGEHKDDFASRAEKALRETKRDYKVS